jgi:DNA gyrase subunit B
VKSSDSYNAESITVLKGLEAVRRRPGMYIGDTTGGQGMHALLWLVVSGAVEEHVHGNASYVRVTIRNDDSVVVEDDGPGISVDPTRIEPELSVLEARVTRLHGGAGSAGRGHELPIVNALSARLEVQVWRGGRRFAQSYAAGDTRGPVHDLGPTSRTGARITFTPDFSLLERRPWDRPAIARHLREIAALEPRLTTILGHRAFRCPAGLEDHVRFLGRHERPQQRDPVVIAGVRDGVGVRAALLWTAAARARVRGFVNHRRVPRGTHLRGLADGLFDAFAAFDPPRFSGVHRAAFREVVRPGLMAAVQVTIERPRFTSWQRDHVESPEVRVAVGAVVAQQLGARLSRDPLLRHALLARMPR